MTSSRGCPAALCAHLLTVVLAASIALVGCGGGSVSKEEYGNELRSTMGDLEAAYGDAIGETGGGGSTPRDVAQLNTAQLALRDAGNRLDDVEPPTGLVDEHEDLVAGVRDMAEAVDLLVRATELADTDPARAKVLTSRFAADDSFRRVGDAAARLDRAGVDAGL